MIDYSCHADENSVLTSYDSNDFLTSSENQDVTLTSDTVGMSDTCNEESISLFDLESTGITSNKLARNNTDTVGSSSLSSNNLSASYNNEEILSTPLPPSGYINYWGDPTGDALYWRHQGSDYSCAIVAQISIYESITGISLDEFAVAEYAENQGWYDPLTGTPLQYTGSVLNARGIETNQYWDNYDGNNYDVNLDTIVTALNNGDKVIAAVDGDEIWTPNYNLSTGRPYDQTEAGTVGSKDTDHAVWVTGVEQEADNTWNIILNDSGSLSGQADAVNYWDFMNAWADSDNFLTIVDA